MEIRSTPTPLYLQSPTRFVFGIPMARTNYLPAPIGGFGQNLSSCPVLMYGDPHPFGARPSAGNPIGGGPIVVRGRRAIVFAGTTPKFGDIDFVCLGGEWSKIKAGPFLVSSSRRLTSIIPSRPANEAEKKALPPCIDPACSCKQN
jgi:hypothetical protein